MYIVCTYDVDERRCTKVMKILRKYLFHVQRSVFEGELNPSKVQQLKNEISKVISETDSILLYYTYNNKQMYKDSLGTVKQASNIII